MSEYQYYEFLALDAPLSQRQQQELRAISSRATISSTRFANFYTFGDLKADPARLVERYFDAHLYLANWGTHALTFRFPSRLLDLKTATRYCRSRAASARAKGGYVILDFASEDEESSDWTDEGDGTGQAAALFPARALIASGDRRALYLGWLLAVQDGDLADSEEEPPCPPGLRDLPAPLAAMVDFLRIDPDLFVAAAAGSADSRDPSRKELVRWARSLRDSERVALLVEFVQGSDPSLRLKAMQSLRASERQASGGSARTRRTAGRLRAEAERRGEARREAETKRPSRKSARR